MKKAQRPKGQARVSGTLALNELKASTTERLGPGDSIIQQILADSIVAKPKVKRAPRKSAIKLVAESEIVMAKVELMPATPVDLKTEAKAEEPIAGRRFIPRHRPKRGLFARTISGAVKSGFFLLPGIYMFSSLLYSHASYAAGSRCEQAQPVRGCVTSFTELDREQKRLNQFDNSIDLKSSVIGVFKDVNGKSLVLNTFPYATLKIRFTTKNVDVVYRGKPADDVKICFEACPGEGRLTWYSDKYGEFKKVTDGLSVGGYKFLLDPKG